MTSVNKITPQELYDNLTAILEKLEVDSSAYNFCIKASELVSGMINTTEINEGDQLFLNFVNNVLVKLSTKQINKRRISR